ncbi:60S ribosomal protein L13 (nucleomorph) [Cryptomonas paramecium]|uniref:60S ribosomal protein L13 n=1 Tax=Cryptomonas paramaecium TaxID=2898 RepID=F2HI51_9CRYP|nr:60S ribosomal protein L13 [Cryptomonas paramecium]AEA39114.1 60S ribosomal protein L13 [Cryptomonas paramecium]|mmetsp:Transcript_86139/g.229923  ORF Transcript_86139/g.229923 Transcript_86139/m.229923 type:complete len:148 (+) Transcript_86139:850-1293(+)
MAKSNGIFSKGHFRKHWQIFVKTWFNQPLQKKKRKNSRIHKEKKRLVDNAPNYIKPLVHCSGPRHNTRIKFGRGFSVNEIKKANIPINYSNSLGIKIDKRRKTSNSLTLYNIRRLKDYKSKIIHFDQKPYDCFFTDNSLYNSLAKQT